MVIGNLPHSILTWYFHLDSEMPPPGARRARCQSFPTPFFCLSTKTEDEGNLFIMLANTVHLELEGNPQFLSISDSHSVPTGDAFHWETRKLLSLLSYRSSVHADNSLQLIYSTGHVAYRIFCEGVY